ncbi:hypothetical protein HF086_012658 [Spodoptera exigua]|uniref:Odorant receptor n=1 Tax=Spodoptera exigua TaxID=7107 RepID=A0A922SL05_SPOEX|nr:hypothetical protein HF086_012658 [Spodoptera exigua]
MAEQKITPFDSFSEVYKLLMWTGYCRLLKKTKSRSLRICHQIYRLFAFLLAVAFNAVHLIFIIQKDEEMLLETTRTSHRLVKFMKISIIMAGVSWAGSLFAKRYQDSEAVVYIYSPFETVSWTGYSFSVMMEVLPLPWTGFGHLGIDCLIATYYAQAEVQLKIIKYTKEVSGIFNHALAFEFFGSAAVLCMVTFKMSYTPPFSMAFAFLAVMLGVLLMQVFLYCYFGNLVQYESDSIMTSVYLSDWLSASPRFRRHLLIAMLRWSKSITPRVSGIIPLSLTTYVSVSYCSQISLQLVRGSQYEALKYIYLFLEYITIEMH